MKRRHLLLWPLSAVMLLALLAGATLYWAARSESVLRWGIDQAATRLPCALSVQGIRGAFMEPVHVQHLICESPDYKIEARNIALVWSPWRLAEGRLDVTSLHMDVLIYTSKAKPAPSQPPTRPDDLTLPIAIDVASLTISTLLVASDTRPTGDDTGQSQEIALTAIDASYRSDKRMHELVMRSLVSSLGTLTGTASIGASSPMPLAATLSVASDRIEGWPLSADIGLSGELQKIDAVITALAGPVRIGAEAALLPFSEMPVQSISANTSDIDASSIDPGFPQTALTLQLSAEPVATSPGGTPSLAGRLTLNNAAWGRLDEQRLPIERIDASFALETSSLKLSGMRLDLGEAGNAGGEAQVTPTSASIELDVSGLDLGATHKALHKTSLNGAVRLDHGDDRQRLSIDLQQAGMRISGDAELAGERVRIERITAQAEGAQLIASGTIELDDRLGYSADGSLTKFDPARFGDFPKAELNGQIRAIGYLRPDWYAEVDYQIAASQFNAVALSGAGKARLSQLRVQGADMELDYGGNKLSLKGNFGDSGDALDFSIDAPRLEVFDDSAGGNIQLSGTAGGTPDRPSLTASLRASNVAFDEFRVEDLKSEFALSQAADPVVRVSATMQGAGRGDVLLQQVETNIEGTLSSHAITLSVAAPMLKLDSQLTGGWDNTHRAWVGVISSLSNANDDYPFRMTREATLELGDRVLLGATEVDFATAALVLDETRFDEDGLQSRGSVTNLQLAPLLALMEEAPAIESTLSLDGRWDIAANDTIEGAIELTRTTGDILLLGEDPLALDMAELRVTIRAADNRINAEALLRSKQIDASASAETRFEKRGSKLGIAGDAPLRLEGKIQMRSIAPVAALASRAVSADGSLKLAVKGSGTISRPQLSGTVEGDNLKIESVPNGVFFREGLLRARFEDDVLELTQLRLGGGDGELTATGRFSARKDVPAIDVQWAATQLAVIEHPQLRLVVSGAGNLALQEKVFSLSGELRADQGRVELRDRTQPTLGEDVVIAGQKNQSQIAAETRRANLDLKLDLGPDFLVTGRGLNARMEGEMRLTSSAEKALSADGEIRTAEGTFDAYGRKLQIEQGVLYFAGPVNNPGINIRAMRKNQPVEAGVEVSGTARDPRVRLVSNPEVPDPDKLAWLVLGRQAESSNNQDARALQSSALALAAGLGTAPLQQQLARSVGLDEISVVPGSEESGGGVVAIGKQISDKIYVTQEFGVNAAGNTLRLSYQLTRRWSVRTESGDTEAIDLFFTISFD